MAIDFGLGLRALQTFGEEAIRGQQMQAQQQAMQQRDYAFGQQQRQDAARPLIAARARTGDYAGARQDAALGGDFNFATALDGLHDDHVKQLTHELDTIGALHPRLKALPMEQRAASAVPILKQAGFSDAELAGVDWSDAGLDNAYQLSASGKAALAARLKAAEPRVVGDGGALVNGSGQVLYENEREAKWQFDPESGSWLQQPGTGGSAGGGVPPSPASGAPEVGTFGRMIQAESGGRQFTNGRVTTSPVGATGIAQVMPATGPEAAAAAGLPWDPNRFRNDAEYNRALGEAYYAKQLASFDGNPEAAAAAYNAGPGRARSSGAPQTRGDWRQALPAETRAYIAKVAPGFAGRNVAATNATPGMSSQPGVINVRPPRSKQKDAPAGYEWDADGQGLHAIRGGPADEPSGTSLSSAAIDQAARVYNLTGQIPSGLGRGGDAQRRIISRAAELTGNVDVGDLVANRAQRKADMASLGTLQRNSANVLAFERTALRNGALALRLSTKAGNGNVTAFNAWRNAGYKATGDPNVAAFNAAVDTFANEYAKVTSSASGGGVTSDSARDHARELINRALSPDQFVAVMRTLSQDMHNRRIGLIKEREEIQARISGKRVQPQPQSRGGAMGVGQSTSVGGITIRRTR